MRGSLPAAVDRHAEVSRPGAYQIGLPLLRPGEQPCAGVQHSAEDRQEMGEPVATTKIVLKHDQVEVDYTLGATPALVYRHGNSPPKSFTASQITANQTALGTLVSVALELSIDVGGERFGFFIPQFDLASGQSAEFRTVGVYERFSGPDSPPREPAWRCIELHGTAQGV